MPRRLLRTPRLDFIVIGAQKAGTTALWRLLEDNPAIRMPAAKEAPFFVTPAYPHELRSYMRALFKDAPRGARIGTVTPVYMTGMPGVPVAEVVRRIGATFPAARLVALLRDPVERAASSHRMHVRRGQEQRPFAEAVADQLDPSQLERARAEPDPTAAYVVGGEYGRVLTAYLEHFPRAQVQIELTADLEHDPLAVVRRTCEFIGVTPHIPRALGRRFHVSGRPRLSAEAAEELKDYLDRHVWPRTRHPGQHRDSFNWFFEIWNVEAAPGEPVDEATAALLRAHYAEDARLLEEVTGARVPWSERYYAGSP